MSFLSKIFSNSHTRSVKRFEPIVARINAFEEAIKALSDEELKAKTVEFRKRLKVTMSAEPSRREGSPDFAEAQRRQTKGEAPSDEKGSASSKVLNDILPEAFAVVRESANRTLRQRHFDVQLIGGLVMNEGAIAEMKTGEGKTLVATLPAYLNALAGKGVHIVTVNDYLSRRDAVWMGQIYDALGLSVAVINHEASFIYDSTRTNQESRIKNHKEESVSAAPANSLSRGQVHKVAEHGDLLDFVPDEKEFAGAESDTLDKERDELGSFKVVHEFLRPCTRKEAYEADITYGTNNEFGFDYLRDNLEYSPDRLRQREPNYAIVDEIDSILIDEARTPLIISAPTRDAESVYKQFAALVSSFKDNEDYTTDEKRKAISLTSAGIDKAEKALGIDNIYTDKGIKFVHHLETAVRAKALYRKDKEYVVKNNEIVIVDEFTGRLQPGRRWSEGLHQAIEAKEGVAIQQESRTYASITFQNFFRMYPKLSGMTGTAATSGEEFYKVYGLDVYVVPTNRVMTRLDRNDQIFRTELGKYKAIAREVKELHAKGQPILIGTVSIEKNEVLSQFLRSEGIPHEILNAKNHEREGEIIAQAGRKGAVTIATNMAGRGVDIKLGGNPSAPEASEEIKSLGGLFVLGTERHEARRIDNQLRGRSGRQGDPGETQFFVSLEDSLMRVFASDMLKSMMGRLNIPEDEAIEHKLISKSLESAQEKIEGFNFDARKHVLEFDDVINTQRGSVYARRRRLLLGSIDDVERELMDIITGHSGATFSHPRNPFLGHRSPGDHSFGDDSTTSLASNGLRGRDTEFSINPSNDPSLEIITKKIGEFGRENFLNAMRIVLLQTIDMYWVEHLEVMDYTRGSVNLRAYGQRDPLVEYKKEGLRLFKEMQVAMKNQVARILPNIIPTMNGKTASSNSGFDSTVNTESARLKEVHENAQMIGAGDGSNNSPSIKKEPEVGRNDPCPCGSGKKFKKCHGK